MVEHLICLLPNEAIKYGTLLINQVNTESLPQDVKKPEK